MWVCGTRLVRKFRWNCRVKYNLNPGCVSSCPLALNTFINWLFPRTVEQCVLRFARIVISTTIGNFNIFNLISPLPYLTIYDLHFLCVHIR